MFNNLLVDNGSVEASTEDIYLKERRVEVESEDLVELRGKGCSVTTVFFAEHLYFHNSNSELYQTVVPVSRSSDPAPEFRLGGASRLSDLLSPRLPQQPTRPGFLDSTGYSLIRNSTNRGTTA